MNKKKILHIITSTTSGGAENALYFFLKNQKDYSFEHQVLSLTSPGLVADKICELGIMVNSIDFLNLGKGIANLIKFFKFIKNGKFHLFHCWMYHANLLGGFFSWVLKIPCIWSIHHHSIDRNLLKKTTIYTIKLGALTSKIFPKEIVYCSPSTKVEHEKFGYKTNGIVIVNGYDSSFFKPDQGRRTNFRVINRIPGDTLVFGHAARFHSTKDQESFIKAFQIVMNFYPETLAILCGKKIDSKNQILIEWIEQAQIKNNVILLGELNDLRAFYNAIDVFVLSSLSEALPNVIGEAMSSGVPCIATDVGDCRYIIANTGMIVPPSNPESMAQAMIQFIKNDYLKYKLGLKARDRIKNNFSINAIVSSFEELYNKIIYDSNPST